MPHFQADSLLEMMRHLFYLPDNAIDLSGNEILPHSEKTLRVFVPESRVVVYAFGGVEFRAGSKDKADRLVRWANVQFDWPGDGDRERAIAERLGLPAPTWTTERRLRLSQPQLPTPGRKRKRDYDTVRVPPNALCPVTDTDQATDLCLAVLSEVFSVPDDRWLWIFDLPFNTDEWPNAIQKPDGWPEQVDWPTDFF